MNKRFDLEYIPVEGDEERLLWQTQPQVMAVIRRMANGDDLTVHRTDNDAQEGHLYL